MDSEQIVDMLYKHDPRTNSTVLIALMHGGVLSSFEIEQDYHMQDTNKFNRRADLIKQAAMELDVKPKAPRDKYEVV